MYREGRRGKFQFYICDLRMEIHNYGTQIFCINRTLNIVISYSPSLGSIAPIVSESTCIGASYMCWLRKAYIMDDGIDLFGSNNEIQTDNEWTRADFECASSSA